MFLQHAQERNLCFHRQFSDLIKQDRAARSDLESSEVTLQCSGKSSTLPSTG